MSNLYLIRHGQAGTRDAYDALSPLGLQQSELLGRYFASQGIRFAAACSGELRRQRQTGEAVRAGFNREDFPKITSDPCWNEFDLDRLYREMAPQLCAGDPEFRRSYEAMRAEVGESAGAPDSPVHRRWLPCDTFLVNAWIAGRHVYDGESWEQFRRRVTGALRGMNHVRRHENVAIFTSATPIAVSTASALDVRDDRIMTLAAVLHNTSFTVLQFRDDRVRLFSFNGTPHLSAGEQRTFR